MDGDLGNLDSIPAAAFWENMGKYVYACML